MLGIQYMFLSNLFPIETGLNWADTVSVKGLVQQLD